MRLNYRKKRAEDDGKGREESSLLFFFPIVPCAFNAPLLFFCFIYGIAVELSMEAARTPQ